MNPFLICMKCHKPTLASELKYVQGKMVCKNCFFTIQKERKEQEEKRKK